MKLKALSISILLLLFGCNLLDQYILDLKDEKVGFTLNITNEARTVIPALNMDVTSYEISGIGPTTSFPSESSSISTYVKSGLELGEWTITVNGKNSSGDVIATGSGIVTLVSGTDSSLTINISPLSGTGTFTYEIIWPDGALDSPAIDASFGASMGTLNPVSFTVGSGTASFTESNLTNGYYTLILDILDGTTRRTSIVEAVRIVAGQTTIGTLSLTVDELGKDGIAPVQFSVDAGEYASSQTVSLSTLTSGATIKYTINGSTPTETTGFVYSDPITINSTQTIRAMAFSDGYNNSSETRAAYTITGSVPVPTVQLDEGLYYTSQSLLFTVPTGDYTVVYTTDGTTPSLSPLQGTAYSAESTITLSTQTSYDFKAMVFNTGNPTESSEEITASYMISDTVADPVFGIASGIYNSNQTLGITTTTTGASIYYTTDGSDPSDSNGTLYSGNINVDGTTTIKAIAVKDSLQSSAIVSRTYTLMPVAPSFNVTGGTYNSEKSVSLSTTSSDSLIYYTLDGSEPTSSSTLYSGAVTINQSSSFKAVTVPNNSNWCNSAVISETYTLKPLKPTFSIEPNSYSDTSFTVDFLCDTEDVTFVYTIDETIPVSGSDDYTGIGRFIAVDTKLKVIASKTGWEDSEVLSGEFYPNSTTVTPANGSDVPGLVLTFPATLNATLYAIEFDDTPDFSSTLESRSDLTTNGHTITTPLTVDRTYYWRYNTYDGYNWSSWSSVYSYTFVLNIGDSYGGGVIFYLDGNGGGLIAAPSDQSSGVSWSNGSHILAGATGTEIGTGQANTVAIINAQGEGTYAAKLCYDLVQNGYDDWFLPSIDELYEMYINRAVITGFSSNYNFYWSSSESSYSLAWQMQIISGGHGYDSKFYNCCVRAIRSF